MTDDVRCEPILCVDPGKAVFAQIQRIYGAGEPELFWERDMERVLERFERATFAVLLISSTALRREVQEGLELLEVISVNCPSTQIIFLVHPRDIDLAAPALRAGTYQYAKLPISDEELKLTVDTAIRRRPNYGPNLFLKKESEEIRFEDMVGGSPAMRNLYRAIRQAAAADVPVLLSGKTGTGKDLAARAIHQLSNRSSEPYYTVHLGALPENLVSSELFGHEKGAFTGATERRLGCFEQAHRGTVFLDEISTIDGKMQVSLLRLLEDHQLHRIGGSQPVKVDVRVIAASNEDLEQMVQTGRFREDLFFRLEVFYIQVPPLAEREGDVPLLIDCFLQRFNQDCNKRIRSASPECLALLESYPWPGNVRELKNVIHRAVVLCSGNTLLPEHLPLRIQATADKKPMVSVPVGTTLAEMERQLVTRTLAFAGGNRTRAAALLGISRRTLYNKIDRYIA